MTTTDKSIIKELAEELHKPVTAKFEKGKVYSSLMDNTWGANFANIQLITKFNIGISFFLCVIDIFSKYTWVIPSTDKKVIKLLMLLKILDESNHKPS